MEYYLIDYIDYYYFFLYAGILERFNVSKPTGFMSFEEGKTDLVVGEQVCEQSRFKFDFSANFDVLKQSCIKCL